MTINHLLAFKNKLVFQLSIRIVLFSALILLALLTATFVLFNRDRTNAETIPQQAASTLHVKLSQILTSVQQSSRFTSRIFVIDQSASSVIRDIVINDEVILGFVFYDTNQTELQKISKPTLSSADDVSLREQDREIYLNAVSGSEGISDPVFLSENIPVVFWFFPIRNAQREIIGVLRTTVDLSSLWDTIVRNDIGNAYIVDEEGRLLISKMLTDTKEQQPLQQLPIVSAFLLGNQEVVRYKSNNNEDVFGSWKALPPSNWAVIAEVPTFILFKDTYVTLLSLLIIIIVVLFLLVTQAIELNNKIFMPMSILLLGVKKFGDGKLETRIKTHAGNELDQIASAFNTMANKLADFYDELENKVKQKTKDLAKKVQEIGEQKATDEALLESIGDGLIGLDNKGRVVIINQKAKEMLEVEGNLLGKQYFELWDVADNKNQKVPLSERPITLALKKGEDLKTHTVNQLSYILKSGKKISIALTLSPIKKDNKVLGVITVFRDITREREIDRMKTEFISLASHQLRTPLSAIKWFSEMLLGGDAGKLSKDQREFTENISESTERMIVLVNSLLDISRIESGRIVIEPELTDFGELISNVIKDLKAKFEEKKINLIISLHPNLPKINLDKQLISQVFLNLLTNAIKYTPIEGNIEVILSKKEKEVLIQVADTGYGIPKKEQPKVFQKFYRGSNILKVETDGNGLGLYLVKAIVESSGGKIWFESEENKGTTFWITIPLKGMKANKGEVKLGAPASQPK